MEPSKEYNHSAPVTVMGEQPYSTAPQIATDKNDGNNHGRDDMTIIGVTNEKGDVTHRQPHTAGTAVLEQSTLIPMTGERKVTKKSEVVSYCLMCKSRLFTLYLSFTSRSVD